MLCAATAALWVRSYVGGDQFHWLRDTPGTTSWVRRLYTLRSSRGGFIIDYIRSPSTDVDGIAAFREDAKIQPTFRHERYPNQSYPKVYPPLPNADGWSWPGVSYHARNAGLHPSSKVWRQQLVLPYWLLALTTSITPLAWVGLRLRRRYYKKRGLCVACGYDLRATPERCPECGTSIDTCI